MAESVSCSRCGTTVPSLPVSWSFEVTERGKAWLCEACTRDNVRSIEGKLDEAWW